MELQPERLYTLCLDFIASNLKETIARPVDDSGNLQLVVPYLITELAQDVLSSYIDDGHSLTDKFLHMFKDKQRASLRSVDLRNSQVSDTAFGWLSRHPLQSIDISGCDKLTYLEAQDCIGRLAPTLQQLKLGDIADLIFRQKREDWEYWGYDFVFKEKKDSEDDEVDLVFKEKKDDEDCDDFSLRKHGATDVLEELTEASQLAVLSLHDLSDPVFAPLLSTFLGSLKSLQYLDLTGCCSVSDPGSERHLEYLMSLKELPYLSSLILHEVFNPMEYLSDCLPVLTELKSLKHLDLSVAISMRINVSRKLQDGQRDGLRQLISKLPLLVSLDISGTNLVGPEIDDNNIYIPIPGLEGRHFDFLGLYQCEGQPDQRRDLPADKVTGNQNINQIRETLKAYRYRHEYLSLSLHNLQLLVQRSPEDVTDPISFIELTCHVMKLNLSHRKVQFRGSTVISEMLKMQDEGSHLRNSMSSRVVRKVVRTLVNSMTTHIQSNIVRYAGLVSLYYLRILEDVWFLYEDVIRVILRTIRDSTVVHQQHVALFILRLLLRPVHGPETRIAGDCGIVEAVLSLIENKQMEEKPNDVLVVGWSNLLSATDETAENAVRVIAGRPGSTHNGLTLFMACYEKFFSTEEDLEIKKNLLWYMTALMVNISIVPELRPKLAQQSYLNVFRELLKPTLIGIDVGDLAASVLCYILSDITDLPSQSCKIAASQIDDSPILPKQSADCSFHAMDIDQDDEGSQFQEQQSNTPSTDRAITREEILSDLVSALKRWKTDSARRLIYQSLGPVLKLLQCKHTVEIRHWACFELCNFTTVNPEKYCSMLKDEGGIEILENIISTPEDQNGDVMALAQITLSNFSDFLEGETN